VRDTLERSNEGHKWDDNRITVTRMGRGGGDGRLGLEGKKHFRTSILVGGRSQNGVIGGRTGILLGGERHTGAGPWIKQTPRST